MTERIREELDRLKEGHGIRILYACESGSRAWGFHSPDSDYDVRFIYAHEQDWYTGIENRDDFIETPKDPVFDLVGYDLRKLLRMFRASNIKIYEWLQSPVIYEEDGIFTKSLRQLVTQYFSPRAGLHHYTGLTRNTLTNDLKGEQVRLKKYFYALRPVLAALWIVRTGGCPPMEFHQLRSLVDEDAVTEAIDRLLDRKKTADEKAVMKPDPVLHQFIGETLDTCSAYAAGLERQEGDPEALNHLFRKTIGLK